MTRYEAVLFDAGGTLIIREPADDEVLRMRWQGIGLAVEPVQARLAVKRSEIWMGEQILKEVNGAPRMPDDEFASGAERAAIQAVWECAAEHDIEHWLGLLNTVPPVKQNWVVAPGSLKMIETLKARGYRMAVVSNFNKSLPDLLAQLNLVGFFDAIVCSAIVGVEKPEPEILRIACRQLGVFPEKAIYIGDHPLDILCARGAGMPVVWLREPGDTLPDNLDCQPDFGIGDLAELVSIL